MTFPDHPGRSGEAEFKLKSSDSKSSAPSPSHPPPCFPGPWETAEDLSGKNVVKLHVTVDQELP